MTFNHLTMIALFGTLLSLTATIMMLLPSTIGVSAQPAIIDKDADTSNSGANETAATENNNMTEVKFLFIQGAESGSISKVNTTASTLELNDVSDKTILFSDRPDRIVSATNTTDFIGNWSMGGPNSFAADAPNAAIVLDDEKQKQDIAVVDLYNPVYNPETKTLKFDITAENATLPINLPLKFGQSTLVIDEYTSKMVFVPKISWAGGAGQEAPGEQQEQQPPSEY